MSDITDADFDFYEVDPNKLDEQWFEQPALMGKASKALADAKDAHRRAKAAEEDAGHELKRVKAELNLACRRAPENFGIDKVTEGSVDNAVLLAKEYQDALEACRVARDRANKREHEADIAMAVVMALSHRKPALENGVELFRMDYFSAPKARSAETREDFSRRERDKVFGTKQTNRKGASRGGR